ncbi:hypothetical protein BH20ACT17_BH20ACT17_14860 [soil metagenome]
MTTDPAAAAIVASTIHLAHALGMQVVAEASTTRRRGSCSPRRGCQLIQGYALALAVDLAPLLARSALPVVAPAG